MNTLEEIAFSFISPYAYITSKKSSASAIISAFIGIVCISLSLFISAKMSGSLLTIFISVLTLILLLDMLKKFAFISASRVAGFEYSKGYSDKSLLTSLISLYSLYYYALPISFASLLFAKLASVSSLSIFIFSLVVITLVKLFMIYRLLSLHFSSLKKAENILLLLGVLSFDFLLSGAIFLGLILLVLAAI